MMSAAASVLWSVPTAMLPTLWQQMGELPSWFSVGVPMILCGHKRCCANGEAAIKSGRRSA